MQNHPVLRLDGDVSVNKTQWHGGTLLFINFSDGLSYGLEVYINPNRQMTYLRRQFNPSQLRQYPPRNCKNRNHLYFTLEDGTHIKIRSNGDSLSKLVCFLNDVKDAGQSGGFSRIRNNGGNSPYSRAYGQQQFATARRNNFSLRRCPVVKSPAGHRMPQNSNVFRQAKESHDFTLEIIGEPLKPSGFSPKTFFRSPEKNRGQRENRTPLKMLTSNADYEQTKRPKQLDLDGLKRPKLTCDVFVKEGGKLGGQVIKDMPAQKSCNLSDREQKVAADEMSPYTGFPNIGNSCFMNSVLQSLLQLRCISDSLETTGQILEKNLPEQSIIRLLLSLLSCQPQEHQKLLGQTLEIISNGSPCFADGQQHDALEFLVQLLDVIKEEVKKASEGCRSLPDPVTNNIEFQLGSSYVCQKCQKIISKKEVLHMMSLNVPNTQDGELSSLHDALKDYFEPQVIEMKCEHCLGTSTKCVQGFATLPRVLIFHLKRYTYLDGTCKIMCPVQVPIHLSLKEFVTDQSVSTEGENHLWTSLNSSLPSSSDSSNVEKKILSTSHSTTTTPRTPVKLSNIKVHQCSLPGRKSLGIHPINSNVPIVLKGGSDSANIASPIPAIGSDVPVEKNEVNVMETISEETEEEQFEKVLKMSRESAQCQEDKELIEAMNRSVQDISCNFFDEYEVYSEDSAVNVKDNSDIENISGPFTYQLASIVSHIGHNADTGHYVANYFDSVSSQWWHFNDQVVHRKSKHSVLESIKTQGYIFLYIARNTSE